MRKWFHSMTNSKEIETCIIRPQKHSEEAGAADGSSRSRIRTSLIPSKLIVQATQHYPCVK